MSKDKRSFFERLTGAVAVEDEMEEQEEQLPSRTLSLAKSGKEGRGSKRSVNTPASAAPVASFNEAGEAEAELTVDVYQTPSDLYIQTMIAGVKSEDLDISISRETVTIKGKRGTESTVNEENYFVRELYWGAFSRTIVLPQEIEVEEAEATEKNGLLTIKLPKIDKDRQTKLRVRSV